MRNHRLAGLPVIALCLTSTLASAQRTLDVQKGVHVRITESHGQRFSGSFVASKADSVILLTDKNSLERTTSSIDVAKFEVSAGRSRLKGAVVKGGIGLGLGLASGALLGAASYSEEKPKECTPDYEALGFNCLFTNACFVVCSRGQAAGFGAFIGGASGFVLGTIIGVATGHERWTTIQFR